MKSVLISIQPKWCELIASGKKTIEVRKTKPKFETPFKVYIYCTKGREPNVLFRWCKSNNFLKAEYTALNCKVIGEFICNEIECFTTDYRTDKEQTERISKQSCVSWLGMEEYKNNALCLYAWHISNLVIYDKPRELSEFKKHNRTCYYDHLGLATPRCKDCKDCQITRPPQSWCYVESESDTE